MGRKGGFAHSYDDKPVRRMQADPVLSRPVRDILLARLAVVVDEIAQQLADEHGMQPDVARLLAAQYAADGTEFLRWVRAGEARAAGIPARGLQDAMGYSSPTSVTRMLPFIDAVAAVQARANETGKAESVADEHGHRISVHPRAKGVSLIEAKRRGWTEDDQ